MTRRKITPHDTHATLYYALPEERAGWALGELREALDGTGALDCV